MLRKGVMPIPPCDHDGRAPAVNLEVTHRTAHFEFSERAALADVGEPGFK